MAHKKRNNLEMLKKCHRALGMKKNKQFEINVCNLARI